MFIVVLSPFIGFVLYHDLMNYLLYICMPICCMTLVNKDNVKCNEAVLCLTQNLHDKKFVIWVSCVYITYSNFWISQLILHFQKGRIWRRKNIFKKLQYNFTDFWKEELFNCRRKYAFSIQSCRSCYATQHLCQRSFYKIFVKFRNSKKKM